MVLNEVIIVMGADALASSHPLSSKEDDIQTPDDIKWLFDSITYSKVRRCLPSAMEVGGRPPPAKPPHLFELNVSFQPVKADFGEIGRSSLDQSAGSHEGADQSQTTTVATAMK